MSDAPPPLPPTFGVRPLPGTGLERGRLTGGVPHRRVDLAPAVVAVVEALLAGASIADTAAATGRSSEHVGAVARRLVDIGAAGPRPPVAACPGTPAVGEVAAVIPARDAEATIEAALDGLAGVGEVVVVDDGSTDRTSSVARAAGAQVIRTEVPAGPAAARNAGIRACTAELVVVLDSDARPVPGWLDALVPHLADPATGGVAPRVVAVDDGTALGRYEAAAGPLDLGDRAAAVRPDGAVTFVSTTALVLRRELWERLGGFDEALRFGEDLDFAWRAAAVQPLVYEPAATVHHPHRATLRAHVANRMGYGSASGPLSRRHPGHPRAAVAPPLLTAAAVAGVAGLPRVAGALGAAAIGDTARRLSGLGQAPDAVARETAAATVRAGRGLAAAVSRPWLPLALAVAAARPGARPAVAAAVLARLALGRERPPAGTSPVEWAALRLLDDLASSAGVLRGCIEACTVAPLMTRPPTGPARTTTVLGTELALP
ncbi:MAG TPA: mycofactocin biosynthesis glycosyltransferase MftF [Acidimicrobiales bacterium]|nr:mycofactocin biosynthesis glycosyltransferase MftF [Acidimicrobiales bacterium]